MILLLIPKKSTFKMKSFLIFLISVQTINALFEEDAGELDFLVSSTGHGPARMCAVFKDSIISSDGNFDTFGDSCFLASRAIGDGKLLWRRNVCADPHSLSGYRVAVSETGNVATVDRTGLLKMWDAATGSLSWDVSIDVADPHVWFPENSLSEVAVGDKASKIFTFHTKTGNATENGSTVFHSKPNLTLPNSRLMETCPKNGAFLSYETSEGFVSSFTTDFALAKQDAVNVIRMTMCTEDSASFLIATERGTTLMLQLFKGKSTVRWMVEEGLGSIDSALLVDASSTVTNVDQAEGSKLLTWKSRFRSQLKDITRVFSAENARLRREQFFGFVKVAILLSNKVNRLYAMDTISSSRASLRYQVDLPDASWHKIIRGHTNALSSVQGIGGGTHGRDILVVSYSDAEKRVHWKCMDATTGLESVASSLKLSAPITQIIPILSHSVCRQSAALILEDMSIVFIPGDDSTEKDVFRHMQSSPNGFFSHVVKKNTGTVESLFIDTHESTVSVSSMGATSFPGEEILSVAYPGRDEVIQSSCSALGDQSLLLKYINPHLFVIVTARATSNTDPYDPIMSTKKRQRKPAGAAENLGTEKLLAEIQEPANLFINVVDSVSGRVIYRASHSSAAAYPAPSVVISENWIIYTFMNDRTRRTEIGVLSLYEGMIDSKGLTAFSVPERTPTFSSFDVKEIKPVILAKTYSMVKGITALGVSSTGGGISGKRLLLSTLSGQIIGIDRKILEPRRPLGKLKDSEQKEGLRQYEELVPAVSLMSLSHSNTIEGVRNIISAPTDLESQSLVLAFGGPDIFFARTSPSRGFDLLPESFNCVLLSFVVTILLIVLLAIKTRVSKRSTDQGWI